MLLALKESAGSRARYLLSPNWPRPRVGLRSHPHELFTMIGSFLPPKAIKPISQVRKATKPSGCRKVPLLLRPRVHEITPKQPAAGENDNDSCIVEMASALTIQVAAWTSFGWS